MTIKSREQLKSYFVKNAIPTEANYTDLIDSQLNQEQDGLFKSAGEPLSVVAAKSPPHKPAIRLYTDYPSESADWSVTLNSVQDPADPENTSVPGFGLSDSSGRNRLFIDAASGRIGIGTNKPAAALEVVGGLRVDDLQLEASSPGGTTSLHVNGSTVTKSLSVSDGMEVRGPSAFTEASFGAIRFSQLTEPFYDDGIYKSGNDIRMLVSGFLRIYGIQYDPQGYESLSEKISLNTGTADLKINCDVSVAGDVVAHNFSQTSDAQLKEDIKPLRSALDKVLALRGVSYRRRDIVDDSTRVGLIAQEVEQVFPEVVSEDASGTRSISYTGLVAPLVEALKEFHAEFVRLQAQVRQP